MSASTVPTVPVPASQRPIGKTRSQRLWDVYAKLEAQIRAISDDELCPEEAQAFTHLHDTLRELLTDALLRRRLKTSK